MRSLSRSGPRASQAWHLTQTGDAVTLESAETGGDPLPRWQTTRQGDCSSRVIRSRSSSSARKKTETDKGKRPDEPSPAPVLALGHGSPHRARSSARPGARSRRFRRAIARSPARTRSGRTRRAPTFQPPASAQAWRDRAAQVRRADARRARALADAAEDAAEPAGLRQARP